MKIIDTLFHITLFKTDFNNNYLSSGFFRRVSTKSLKMTTLCFKLNFEVDISFAHIENQRNFFDDNCVFHTFYTLVKSETNISKRIRDSNNKRLKRSDWVYSNSKNVHWGVQPYRVHGTTLTILRASGFKLFNINVFNFWSGFIYFSHIPDNECFGAYTGCFISIWRTR